MGEVKPPAQPRDTNTLNTGQAIADAQRRDAAWPVATWWEAYGDPQLNALVGKAIARNPQLAEARDRIAGAQAIARGAKAATLPGVQANASFVDSRFSGQQFFPPPYAGNFYWNNDAEFDLGYDLDLWGRNRSALAAALDGVQVSLCEEQEARLALEGAVVRAYSSLSLQYALQGNLQAILLDQLQTLHIAQRRLSAGLGTAFDVSQAQTLIASTQAQLEQVDARMQILRHQLAALAGGGPGDGDAITAPDLHFDQAAILPGNVPAELVGRRPDVVAQRWRVQRAAHGVDVARASFYPDINLTAFVGVLSLNFNKLFTSSAENLGAGPAISLPIFDGGRLRAGLQAHTAEYNAAVDAYDATIVSALEEVANNISNLQSLAREERKRSDALESAQRARALTLRAFRAGLTDYLNVLTAESALNAQRGLIAEIHFQQMLAATSLNQALGGGLAVGGHTIGPAIAAQDSHP